MHEAAIMLYQVTCCWERHKWIGRYGSKLVCVYLAIVSVRDVPIHIVWDVRHFINVMSLTPFIISVILSLSYIPLTYTHYTAIVVNGMVDRGYLPTIYDGTIFIGRCVCFILCSCTDWAVWFQRTVQQVWRHLWVGRLQCMNVLTLHLHPHLAQLTFRSMCVWCTHHANRDNRFYIGHTPVLVVGNPEMVKEVTIKQSANFMDRSVGTANSVHMWTHAMYCNWLCINNLLVLLCLHMLVI